MSLEEFIVIIRHVKIASLEFHLYRGDFEKWATEVLEAPELAKRIHQMERTIIELEEKLNKNEQE